MAQQGIDRVHDSGDPFLHGLTLISVRISNHIIHMLSKVWDEITYSFPNFNGAAVEVWEWIINIIAYFIMDVVSYPCWNKS